MEEQMVPPEERAVGDTGETCQMCGCTWKKNYVIIARLAGIAICITVMVVDVVTFLPAITKDPWGLIARGYVIVFAFWLSLAELRFFGPMKTCGWLCLKYFYFLCTYPGKGIFYMIMGALLLKSELYDVIFGFVAMAVGCANFALYAVFRDRLPTYTDEDQLMWLKYGVEPAPPNSRNAYGAPPPGAAGTHQSDMETGMSVAQLAYDNRQYITKENVDAAAKFAAKNKQHLNKENFDKAAKVASVANTMNYK
eukprot:TRINITY_DN71583_c0_g1_i1.p1 TRINITY_DN71583_c0_g1~~TRINITY_DN71583_c0_g1_i1.p1  ORF type:complete len:252 (+),score=22.03 TRINITY_DN71583_c0_g1_i1:25-780(+)